MKIACTLLCVTIAMLLAATAVAAEKDLDGLRENFKQRLPELKRLKSQGAIGETVKGYVAIVDKETAEAANVVKEENADRQTLYKALADKEGTSPEKVAERNAKRNFEKASAGEYLQGADGKWQKKS